MSTTRKRFVVCLQNDGYGASLELRKIYETRADAARHGQIRVVDESSDYYPYPADWFSLVELSPSLRRAVLAAV